MVLKTILLSLTNLDLRTHVVIVADQILTVAKEVSTNVGVASIKNVCSLLIDVSAAAKTSVRGALTNAFVLMATPVAMDVVSVLLVVVVLMATPVAMDVVSVLLVVVVVGVAVNASLDAESVLPCVAPSHVVPGVAAPGHVSRVAEECVPCAHAPSPNCLEKINLNS